MMDPAPPMYLGLMDLLGLAFGRKTMFAHSRPMSLIIQAHIGRSRPDGMNR